MKNRFGEELVPCKYCKQPTPMTATQMCDGCWELQSRMSQRMDLVKKILREKGYQITDIRNY